MRVCPFSAYNLPQIINSGSTVDLGSRLPMCFYVFLFHEFPTRICCKLAQVHVKRLVPKRGEFKQNLNKN